MSARVKTICINGDFWRRNLTGVERDAIEITAELDKIAPAGLFELVVPANTQNLPQYKNIRIVFLKSDIKSFTKWTQVDFQKYVISRRGLALDFTNTCPFFVPGIEYINDIYCALHPNDFPSLRDKFYRFYSCLMYWRIAKKAKKVVAISEYTKKTIVERYKIKPERVAIVYAVLGKGYGDVAADFSIFERLPQLKDKEFYFTLGSLSTRKNLKWIARHAELFPNEIFLISGKALLNVVPPELKALKELPNVIMPGYLSDGEVKAVYAKCKAFVLPSYFEGFGLPPLEALSCGAKVIISNRTSLPEIYGGSAYYIDPDEPNVNLDDLLKQSVEPPDTILKKFTAKNAAQSLYKVVEECL